MAVNSPSDICNLGVGQLGNYATVSDITTPTNDIERTCSQWYDICRQFVLKLMKPNFALTRVIVGQLAEVPAFGYAYFYEYPNLLLAVQGVGNVKEKINDYSVEATPSGVKAIAHDTNYAEGMPVRGVIDVQNIPAWSPEAKLMLAQYIAAYTCLQITQDANKAKMLKAGLPAEMSQASAMNAQENMPIRISRSRFQEARRVGFPSSPDKK